MRKRNSRNFFQADKISRRNFSEELRRWRKIRRSWPTKTLSLRSWRLWLTNSKRLAMSWVQTWWKLTSWTSLKRLRLVTCSRRMLHWLPNWSSLSKATIIRAMCKVWIWRCSGRSCKLISKSTIRSVTSRASWTPPSKIQSSTSLLRMRLASNDNPNNDFHTI